MTCDCLDCDDSDALLEAMSDCGADITTVWTVFDSDAGFTVQFEDGSRSFYPVFYA